MGIRLRDGRPSERKGCRGGWDSLRDSTAQGWDFVVNMPFECYVELWGTLGLSNGDSVTVLEEDTIQYYRELCVLSPLLFEIFRIRISRCSQGWTHVQWRARLTCLLYADKLDVWHAQKWVCSCWHENQCLRVHVSLLESFEMLSSRRQTNYHSKTKKKK